MAKKLPYKEGTAFSVPLREGGYGLGVVARMAPKGKLVLGYFFGPRKETPEFDLGGLQASDAVLVGRFGDLHLFDGKWKTLGQVPHWDRARWPLPLFLKRDPLGCIPDRVVIYDEDALDKPGRWEARAVIPHDLIPDGLMGAGFVEIKLGILLD